MYNVQYPTQALCFSPFLYNLSAICLFIEQAEHRRLVTVFRPKYFHMFYVTYINFGQDEPHVSVIGLGLVLALLRYG